MGAKTPKYAPKLTALLSKHNEVCNEIATLALQHEIHETHVHYTLDVIRSRSAELKKQLEQKSAKIELSLPDLDEDEEDADGKKSAPSKKVTAPDASDDKSLSSPSSTFNSGS